MNEVESLLQDAVDTGVVPGVVGVVTSADEIVLECAAGFHDLDAGSVLERDAVFRVSSMVKPITAMAAMQLAEEGNWSLDTPAADVVPEIAAVQVLERVDAEGPAFRPPARAITIRHLLTHTAGFAYRDWNARLDDYLRRYPPREGAPLEQLREWSPLLFDPGDDWAYGTSFDWLGIAVERVSGFALDEYLREHVFVPLGMTETSFAVAPSRRSRIPSLYERGRDGSFTLVSKAPISPAPVSAFVGGSGLHTTAGDYARFMQALLDPTRSGVLSVASIDLMSRNQIGGLVAGQMRSTDPSRMPDVAFFPGQHPKWGFGFLINPEAVPGGRSAGSLSWAGGSGTYFWVDRARGIGAALLTQMRPFCDGGVLELLARFERTIYGQL